MNLQIIHQKYTHMIGVPNWHVISFTFDSRIHCLSQPVTIKRDINRHDVHTQKAGHRVLIDSGALTQVCRRNNL